MTQDVSHPISNYRQGVSSDDAVNYSGICAVCGREGVFTLRGWPPRENYECAGCGSTLRYRHQAEVLVTLYSRAGGKALSGLVHEPQFRELSVYEPGITGPFRTYLSSLPDYIQSYYRADVAPGGFRHGIRCEDLEQLTLQDRSVDLVITSDIFEHVRRPWHAFAEVHRILRPGGRHVFTVPFDPKHATRPRVDVSDDGDVLLMPRRYHGSPVDPDGSLVYTDFGQDLPARLEFLRFKVIMSESRNRSHTFACERVT